MRRITCRFMERGKSQAELKLYLQRKRHIARDHPGAKLEETEHDSGEAIRVLARRKHYKAGEDSAGGEKDHCLSDEAGIFMEDIRREMKEREDAFS